MFIRHNIEMMIFRETKVINGISNETKLIYFNLSL